MKTTNFPNSFLVTLRNVQVFRNLICACLQEFLKIENNSLQLPTKTISYMQNSSFTWILRQSIQLYYSKMTNFTCMKLLCSVSLINQNKKNQKNKRNKRKHNCFKMWLHGKKKNTMLYVPQGCWSSMLLINNCCLALNWKVYWNFMNCSSCKTKQKQKYKTQSVVYKTKSQSGNDKVQQGRKSKNRKEKRKRFLYIDLRIRKNWNENAKQCSKKFTVELSSWRRLQNTIYKLRWKELIKSSISIFSFLFSLFWIERNAFVNRKL